MNIFGGKWAKITPWALGVIVCVVGSLFWFSHKDGAFSAGPAIPVAMALDDNYLYPTVVAITSMMENASEETKYDFFIMHPSEFGQQGKLKLKSLENRYKLCNITLIDMGDAYKNANDKGHITTPAYYRLSLSNLLPNIDKIIWMDGDTITFGDLSEMYDTDMNGYYYKGFLDENVYAVKDFTTKNDHCICSGVMLVNLKELRKDDMVNVFSKFIEENNDRLIQHDQTTINATAYKKTGILPAKYGIYNYLAWEELLGCTKKYLCSYGYPLEELESAYKNPTILHCVYKPWNSLSVRGATEWWNYAKKTDFYKEICAKYPIV